MSGVSRRGLLAFLFAAPLIKIEPAPPAVPDLGGPGWTIGSQAWETEEVASVRVATRESFESLLAWLDENRHHIDVVDLADLEGVAYQSTAS